MKKTFLIGIALGVIIGWVLGYLRLPLIEEEYAFSLGVGYSILAFLLLFSLILIWKKYKRLVLFFKSSNKIKASAKANKGLFQLWQISFSLLFILFFIGGYFFYSNYGKQKASEQKQLAIIREQSALIEAIKKDKQKPFLVHVLERVRAELGDAEQDTLSNDLINNISALSTTLKPYPSLEGDSLSREIYSPERGQLLLSLSSLPIDSLSFHRIKLRTSFAYSNLKKVSLRTLDLQDVDLQNSELSHTNFRDAKLTNAHLSEGNLRGADLLGSNLVGADLKRANMSWVNANQATFDDAYMSGINLSAARLKNTTMKRVELRWADLTDALVLSSNLEYADVVGANLKRVNLSNSILTDTDLRYADFTQADLSFADLRRADLKFATLYGANLIGVKLDSVEIDDPRWIEKLIKWQVKGEQEIKSKYQIVESENSSTYHIRKLKN